MELCILIQLGILLFGISLAFVIRRYYNLINMDAIVNNLIFKHLNSSLDFV